MKFEIEPRDIESIAQRIAEIVRPLVLHQKENEKDVIFDVSGLAGYFHVNRGWVYKQVSLKAIPFFKAGKFPRFRKRDIDRWMESRSVRPIPPLKVIKTRGVAT